MTAEIQRIYREVLGRDADAPGLNYWLDSLRNGMSLASIRSAIATCAEAAGAIDRLYRLVLERPADPGGSSVWQANLAQGWTLSDVQNALSNSAEAQAIDDTGMIFSVFELID